MQFELHMILPPENLTTGKDIVDWCIANTPNTEHGFAGWETQEYLKEHADYYIADQDGPVTPHTFDTSEIQAILTDAIHKCHETLPWKDTLHIFVYPSYNKFTYSSLDGVMGFCPEVNTCELFINPTHPNWKEALAFTLAHEYNHSQYYSVRWFNTVRTTLHAEGLAEHYREATLGGDVAESSQIIPDEECQSWLEKIAPELDSNDKYSDIFFGSDIYPKWLGYTLGYWLVSKYRKTHPNLSMRELIELEPEELF